VGYKLTQLCPFKISNSTKPLTPVANINKLLLINVVNESSLQNFAKIKEAMPITEDPHAFSSIRAPLHSTFHRWEDAIETN